MDIKEFTKHLLDHPKIDEDEIIKWAKKHGPTNFKYLDDLEIVNEHTPATWKDKLL